MPFQIQVADILSIRCDAIVNPTDEQFSGSGGLDAQIHSAAGQEMRFDCDRLTPLNIGEAAITPGYGRTAFS
jgi:O-acetyl-ADP-ribose deacetylase (regulator of RNase III)